MVWPHLVIEVFLEQWLGRPIFAVHSIKRAVHPESTSKFSQIRHTVSVRCGENTWPPTFSTFLIQFVLNKTEMLCITEKWVQQLIGHFSILNHPSIEHPTSRLRNSSESLIKCHSACVCIIVVFYMDLNSNCYCCGWWYIWEFIFIYYNFEISNLYEIYKFLEEDVLR